MRDLVVSIPLGKLQGTVSKNINGDPIFQFLGIPYAKPPIGDLRFKAPHPVEPWQGIKNATTDGDSCYSRDTLHDTQTELRGSENCLVLNVFTREVKPNTLKPVMVFIHGGAFTMGCSRTDMFGPGLLLTDDIVLVTINYRLGALGFLNSDDPTLEIPGNAGLKDQNMALKWIQNYIQFFGGNPNNVTIFGESAGAASVHFHILSPKSKGLFHKAVMQSGDVFQSWPWGVKNNIQYMVEALGKTARNDKEGLEILQQTSVKDLYAAQEKCTDYLIHSSLRRLFAPIIESTNPTAFLTKEPGEIMSLGEQNHVPIILGYNKEEGMIAEMIEQAFPGTLNFNDKEKLTNVIPWQFRIRKGSSEEKEFVKKIQDIYFKDVYSKENIYALYTDSLFLSGLMETLSMHLKTNRCPIYFYRMSLDTEINFLKNVKKWNHIKGTCHADDLGYLFTSTVNPKIKPGSIEELSYKRVVQLWTSFAKNGRPESSDGQIWKPVSNLKHIPFLDIGKELAAKENPEPERAKFWMDVYGKYGFKIYKNNSEI